MTDLIPPSFKGLLDNTSLASKIGMLSLLSERIKADKIAALPNELSSFIEYIPNLIRQNDPSLTLIEQELNKLLPNASQKVTSKWLSTNLQPYSFGKKTYDASDLSLFPGLHGLLGVVNSHVSSTGDLNSCLINRYSSHSVAGRLHADDEDIISDASSIVTVSLGAERTIDFAQNSAAPLIKSLTLEPQSAFVMRPGCQQVMKHRLNKGEPGSGLRFSISFRRAVVPTTKPSPCPPLAPSTQSSSHTTASSDSPSSQSSSSSPSRHQAAKKSSEPLVLIAGDSLSRGLKPHLLGKKKVEVINISHGGDRIYETEQAINKFSNEQLDPGKNHVEKVFLSIGANDIRNLFSRDVAHLRAPIRRLVNRIRDLFGSDCKIYFQSLLPFEAQNQWTVRNVCAFNTLLRRCCYELKCYYIYHPRRGRRVFC